MRQEQDWIGTEFLMREFTESDLNADWETALTSCNAFRHRLVLQAKPARDALTTTSCQEGGCQEH